MPNTLKSEESAHPEQRLSSYLDSLARLAARHELTVEQVVRAKQAMEFERQNDILESNGAQTAALAAAVAGIGEAVTQLGLGSGLIPR